MDPSGGTLKSIIFRRSEQSNSFPDENPEPMKYGQATTIGFRQLDKDWWPATPLYALTPNRNISNPDNIHRNHPPPWKITFEKTGETETEEFKLLEIIDNNGEEVNLKFLKLSLKTIHEDEGYWLDTGKIRIN